MKRITAYEYFDGSGCMYWDCYRGGSFVARVYSRAELSLLGPFKIVA